MTRRPIRPLPRSRVVDRLRRAVEHRITLVTAPAGFGKTVAIDQLLASWGEPFVRFAPSGPLDLRRAAHGLAQAFVGIAGADRLALAAALEAPADGDPDELARTLLRGMGDFSGLVVLDGFSAAALREPAVRRLLLALFEHDGPARWLVGTRYVAEFPVASWMSYGASDVPIGPADLAFTADEARQVALADGAHEPERVAGLQAWTNGWPAAFVLALRQRADAAKRVVGEYLAEQVFEELGERERETLLALAPLPLVDIELAAAYAPLDQHAVAAVFRSVAPLVENVSEGVYRCQPLFRELLGTRLRLRGREAYAAATARAGRALLAAQHHGEALAVFTNAGDADAVASLLCEHGGELIERGGAETVTAAVRALAERGRAEAPAILSLRATLASYAGNFSAAAAFSERAMAAAEDPRERLHIAHCFALDLVKRNDAASSERLRRVVPVLTASTYDPEIPLETRVAVLGTLALALMMLGDPEGARMRIGTALEAAAATDDHRMQAAIYHQASYIAYLEGDAQRSSRFATVATRLALEHGLYALAARSYSIQYAIATGLDERFDRALEALDGMFAAAERSGDSFLQVEALAGTLDIYAERGDAADVERTVLRIDRLDVGVEVQSTSVLPAKALSASWQGNFRAAYDLVSHSALDQPTALRQAVRWGEIALYAAASGLREQALAASESAGRAVRGVTIQTHEERQRAARASALSALALVVVGSTASANAVLRELERSRRELSKRMRALTDAVRNVYLCVEMGSPDGLPRALHELRLVGYGGLARLIETLRLERGSDASLISQLTRAEVDVLRALARGGSSTKVAADLGRSVNTVNVHVKSIMRKLGCTSRHEALAIARDHGLVG